MIDENREKMSDILDNFSPFCTGEKLSGEMLSGHRISDQVGDKTRKSCIDNVMG